MPFNTIEGSNLEPALSADDPPRLFQRWNAFHCLLISIKLMLIGTVESNH